VEGVLAALAATSAAVGGDTLAGSGIGTVVVACGVSAALLSWAEAERTPPAVIANATVPAKTQVIRLIRMEAL
jgi:hypothetical protein